MKLITEVGKNVLCTLLTLVQKIAVNAMLVTVQNGT